MQVFNLLDGPFDHDDDVRPGYALASVRVGDAIGDERIGATMYELADGERVCPYHYEPRPARRGPPSRRAVTQGQSLGPVRPLLATAP